MVHVNPVMQLFRFCMDDKVLTHLPLITSVAMGYTAHTTLCPRNKRQREMSCLAGSSARAAAAAQTAAAQAAVAAAGPALVGDPVGYGGGGGDPAR